MPWGFWLPPKSPLSELNSQSPHGPPPTNQPTPRGGRPCRSWGSGWLPRPPECPSGAVQSPHQARPEQPGRPGNKAGRRAGSVASSACGIGAPGEGSGDRGERTGGRAGGKGRSDGREIYKSWKFEPGARSLTSAPPRQVGEGLGSVLRALRGPPALGTAAAQCPPHPGSPPPPPPPPPLPGPARRLPQEIPPDRDRPTAQPSCHSNHRPRPPTTQTTPQPTQPRPLRAPS